MYNPRMKDRHLCPHCGKAVYTKQQEFWQTVIAGLAGLGIVALVVIISRLF
jgi:hypothetical protein